MAPNPTSTTDKPLSGVQGDSKRSFFLANKASSYSKIAFLEFINTAIPLIFNLLTKLVFVARDGVMCLMAVVHSVFLIPLDFLLILAYSSLTFIQKDIIEKKKKKWSAKDNSGSKSAQEFNNQLDAIQKSDLANLNYTRRLFWTGNPISLRNHFLMDGGNNQPEQVFPAFVPVYPRVPSGPRLRIASDSSGDTISTSKNRLPNNKRKGSQQLTSPNPRKARLPQFFGERRLPSRRVSSLYSQVNSKINTDKVSDSERKRPKGSHQGPLGLTKHSGHNSNTSAFSWSHPSFQSISQRLQKNKEDSLILPSAKVNFEYPSRTPLEIDHPVSNIQLASKTAPVFLSVPEEEHSEVGNAENATVQLAGAQLTSDVNFEMRLPIHAKGVSKIPKIGHPRLAKVRNTQLRARTASIPVEEEDNDEYEDIDSEELNTLGDLEGNFTEVTESAITEGVILPQQEMEKKLKFNLHYGRRFAQKFKAATAGQSAQASLNDLDRERADELAHETVHEPEREPEHEPDTDELLYTNFSGIRPSIGINNQV